MLKEQWLEQVNINKDKLREFICNYHPINLRPRKNNEVMSNDITAPNPERACEAVRELIRKEALNDPVIQFDIAVQKNDYITISGLLGAAWFGVPESTSCWQIEGFKEAVDLLDDPVEEEFEEIVT